MTRIGFYIFLIFLFTSPISSLNAQKVELDWEVKKLEEKLQGQVLSGVREYLGDKKKINAFIQIDAKKTSTEKVVKGFKDNDFGYLSVDEANYDTQVERKLVVEQVNANVFVFEKVDKDVERNLKLIVKSALRGYKTNIAIRVMPSPLIPEEPKVQPKEEVKDAPKEPVSEEPFSLKSFILKHASDIIKLVSMVVVGILALIGIYLFAKAIVAAFKALGEAMKSSTDRYADSLNTQKASEDNTEDEREENAENDFQTGNLEKSYAIIDSCLSNFPQVFKNVILRDKSNVSGFKTLVPNLVAHADKLKQLLPQSFFSEVENSQSVFSGQEYALWLKKLGEDLSVGLMKESGYFSYLLDPGVLEKVYSKKLSHLVEATIKIHSGTLYKFIFDFLPSEESTRLMERFDESAWKLLLQERHIDGNRLNDDVVNLISVCEEIEERERREINDSGLAKILGAPMTTYLENSGFKKTDEILAMLSEAAPDFGKSMKNKFWTPSIMLQIPDSHLRERFNSISIESRVRILLFIQDQEDLRKHMFGLLPEGKVTMIVNDQLKLQGEGFDEKARSNAEGELKMFLKELYAECERGVFALMEAPLAPVIEEKTEKITLSVVPDQVEEEPSPENKNDGEVA